MFHTNAVSLHLYREREQELYGPKKRGPKPKNFVLKVRISLHCASFLFTLTGKNIQLPILARVSQSSRITFFIIRQRV